MHNMAGIGKTCTMHVNKLQLIILYSIQKYIQRIIRDDFNDNIFKMYKVSNSIKLVFTFL